MDTDHSPLSFVQDLSNLFTDRDTTTDGTNASSATSNATNATSNTNTNTRKRTGNQLTDLLVEKLLAMAIPPQTELGANTLQSRVRASSNRPPLSVQTMSKNFIQMNSRLSAAFELIDALTAFFSWHKPTLTLTLLMLYTHLVLTPQVLLSLPFFAILIIVMTPAYESTHSPDTHTILGKNNPVIADGPPLAEAELPQPASEFSKEFILNLTDLQNHMVLYTNSWDFVARWLSKIAYFSHEPLSVVCFLCLLSMGTLSLMFGNTMYNVFPLKPFLVLIGWAITIMFHPYLYDYIFDLVYSEETRYYLLNKTNKLETVIQKNFEFREPQEQREVEMFEVHQFNKALKEWRLMFYLDSDFTKLANERLLSGVQHPKGVTTKKEVKPPCDWTFIDSDDWKIDLSPETWVKTHQVSCFVHIDHETKWVFDREDWSDQPQFRRRRWTRIVTRESQMINKNNNANMTIPIPIPAPTTMTTNSTINEV